LRSCREPFIMAVMLMLGIVRESMATREIEMAEKLGIGATFPKLVLNLVDGGTLNLPDDLDSKYRIILFYRGHW
jgi:hypothetical protein